MTSTIREWLPSNALNDRRLQEKFSAAVNAWHRRWFLAEADSYQIKKFPSASTMSGRRRVQHQWVSVGYGVAWDVDDEVAQELAKAVIDAPEHVKPPTETDRRLLAKLAHDAVGDLASLLGQAWAGQAADHFSPGAADDLELLLTSGRRSLPELRFAINSAAAVSARKALIASPAAPALPPFDCLNCVAGEPLMAEVRLGAALIAASELFDLAEGDVLVLDTLLNGAFPVISLKSGTQICLAKLTQDEGRMVLQAAE